MLLEERQQLLAEVRDIEDVTLAEMQSDNADLRASQRADAVDFASDTSDLELALNLRSLEAEQLEEIEKALQAIDRGSYGICEDCGQPIDIQRLRVKPMARFCVPCLRKRESRR